MTKNIPLLKSGKLYPSIQILTDYPRDDLASDEVRQALVSATAIHDLDFHNIDVAAVNGMDTVMAGFKTAQLSLNSKLGFGHVFHTNCAPRKNIVSDKSKGEGVVVCILPSGASLLLVNSGYTLAPLFDLVKSGKVRFFQTHIKDAGSQFRSRDFFPDATVLLSKFLVKQMEELGEDKITNLLNTGKGHELLSGFELLGEEINSDDINQLPMGSVYYIDNFGNIKTNIDHEELLSIYSQGTIVTTVIGNTVVDAIIGSAGFSQGEGIIALTKGSSGWKNSKSEEFRFTEIFLRGGSAKNSFGSVNPGDQIILIAKSDMKAALLHLQDAGVRQLDGRDIFLFSQAELLRLFVHHKLIVNGYDASNLKEAIANNNLASYF